MTVTKNPGLGYVKETKGSYGNTTVPNSGNNNLRVLRLVSEDYNTAFQRDESNEVRNDAQSSGSVIVSANVGGSLQLQYSLDTYDDFLVGLLYADDDSVVTREDGWTSAGFTPLADVTTADEAVTFEVSDSSLNHGTGWDRTPAEGEIIFATGFGNKNLDTVFRVGASPTSTKITLVNDTGEASVAAYAGLSSDLAGTAVRIYAVRGYTRNSTYERSFQIVRFYSDTSLAGTTSTTGLDSTDWALFRGMIPNSLQLAVAPGQAGWTGTMSFIGKDEQIIDDATSAAVGGFDVQNWNEAVIANSNPLANAIQSVVMVRLLRNGLAETNAVRVDPLSFSMNVANNAQEVSATRNLGAIAINQQTFSASVQMSLLYIDSTYHAGMLADDFYEVEIAVADADGRCQLWRFPKARYVSERPNPGRNNPVAQNLTFTAEAGGAPYDASDGAGYGTAGTARMVEVLSFYQRSA